MALFRTESMTARHEEWRKATAHSEACVICEREALQAFKHWKIIENHYPYDRIASTHHMLVPLRHVTEDALNNDEKDELVHIKLELLDPVYDFIIEAAHKNKSIPKHFHLHLIVTKDTFDTI